MQRRSTEYGEAVKSFRLTCCCPFLILAFWPRCCCSRAYRSHAHQTDRTPHPCWSCRLRSRAPGPGLAAGPAREERAVQIDVDDRLLLFLTDRAQEAWGAMSAHELHYVVLAKPDVLVVLAAHVELREDILEADILTPRIDVVHGAVHLKIGDHLLHVLVDHQRMGLTRRLERVGAFGGHPIVLEISPAALEY